MVVELSSIDGLTRLTERLLEAIAVADRTAPVLEFSPEAELLSIGLRPLETLGPTLEEIVVGAIGVEPGTICEKESETKSALEYTLDSLEACPVTEL